MCGVWGISYGPEGPSGELWTPSELMELMFPAIVHRGHHAWGYMYHQQGENAVDYFCRSGSATHKTASDYMAIEHTRPLSWLAGHVRFATSGSPANHANNHPILHGDIVGMHNGVLRDWRAVLKETGREDPTAEVDSEAIFAAVNKWGIMAGLRKIKGDMVSVFVDVKEPSVLYLARTFGRPLWYGTTEAGSLVWASEPEVIESTGITTREPLKEWKAVNRVMKIVSGSIVNTRQFRKPEAKPKPSTTTGSGYRWGTSASSQLGAGMMQTDQWGGTYLGMNTWRVKDGATTLSLTADKYIEFIIKTHLREQVEARAQQLVDDELMRRLHSMTTFLDGKNADSRPEPGELDDDLTIAPDPVVVTELAS